MNFIKYIWAEEGWTGKLGILVIAPLLLGFVLAFLVFLVDLGTAQSTVVPGVVVERVYKPQQEKKNQTDLQKIGSIEAYGAIVKLSNGEVQFCRTDAVTWANCDPGTHVDVLVVRGSVGWHKTYTILAAGD